MSLRYRFASRYLRGIALRMVARAEVRTALRIEQGLHLPPQMFAQGGLRGEPDGTRIRLHRLVGPPGVSQPMRARRPLGLIVGDL